MATTGRPAPTISAAFARVNGGSPVPAHLRMEQDGEVIRSASAQMPDADWSWTDPAGHLHYWTTDSPTANGVQGVGRGELVTCGSRQVGTGAFYEDDAEEIMRTEYFCRICEAIVEPQWVPDHQAEAGIWVPGVRSWHVTTHHPAPGAWSEQDQVVIEYLRGGGAPPLLGVAVRSEMEFTAGRVRVEWLGTGPLGVKWKAPR